MTLDDLHVPYVVPTALLATALALKSSTIARAWRDADVRATTLLLGLATAVFVCLVPVNLHRINTVTSTPNFAALWCYSLLTAFCATCLTKIMRWREAPSDHRRRKMHRVYWTYSGLIIGLWVTFFMAEVPDERLYDFDTYYAGTPWAREHILLYLVAHMVSAIVAASMIWRWLSQVESRWLKGGLVSLQVGYAFGIVFDVLKMTAVTGRWTGQNWDFLSTRVAPAFALLDAVLVAIGFIVPQAGPYLQERIRDAVHYRRLRPLWKALHTLAPAAAQARVGRWAPLDLRLLQRQQRIHDALLRLAPYFDDDLYGRAYEAARARAHHSEETARGIAGAIALADAVQSHDRNSQVPAPPGDTSSPIGTDVTDHIDEISRAVRRTGPTGKIRRQVTPTESVTCHR